MRIGFFIWGAESRDKAAHAYYHRIDTLRVEMERRGHQTVELYSAPFEGKLKLAPLCKKSRLRDAFADLDAVYLGATDCAAFAAAALPSGDRLVFDSHTPIIGERLMMFKANKTPRNLFIYLRSLLHESLAARRCRSISTVSDSAIDYYRRVFKRSPEDLFLARNMIEASLFQPRPLPESDRICFAYVGGMDRWQGVTDLIEAYPKTSRSFDLTIVGFGDEQVTLMSRARQYGIEAHPRMPRAQAIEHLVSSHFGVTATPAVCAKHMPGAFPTKWAEILGLGRACMVTRAYDCAQITQDENFGIVCEPGVAGIAEGLERAAKVPREQIQDMGLRGSKWVHDKCSVEAVGTAWEEAASHAAASRGAAP